MDDFIMSGWEVFFSIVRIYVSYFKPPTFTIWLNLSSWENPTYWFVILTYPYFLMWPSVPYMKSQAMIEGNIYIEDDHCPVVNDRKITRYTVSTFDKNRSPYNYYSLWMEVDCCVSIVQGQPNSVSQAGIRYYHILLCYLETGYTPFGAVGYRRRRRRRGICTRALSK